MQIMQEQVLSLGNFTKLAKNLHNRRPWRSRQISTLPSSLPSMFPHTLQQRLCIKISKLGPFLLNLTLMCNIFTITQNVRMILRKLINSIFHANYARTSVVSGEFYKSGKKITQPPVVTNFNSALTPLNVSWIYMQTQ